MRGVFTSSVVIASIIATSAAFAADTTTSDAQLRAQIRQVTLQTQALQKEASALQSELKRNRRVRRQQRAVKRMPAAPASTKPYPKGQSDNPYAKDPLERLHYGNTVVTSPFIGLQTTYLPFDLLHWQPSMNEDLVLLTNRQQLQNAMKAHQIPFERPIVEISGAVEGMADGAWGYNTSVNNSTIALANVELDINAAISNWATGFATFNYNNQPVTTGSRDPRGVIFVKRGFLTIGNLNVTPFYFTFGEMYPPFGRYSNGMISTPLTTSTGRILTATALLGYFKEGFNASIFAYDGDEITSTGSSMMQAGANLSYTEQLRKERSIDFGVSAITNIGDAQGMLNNFLPPVYAPAGTSTTQTNFSGFANNNNFGTNTSSNALAHRVPAGDVNTKLTLGSWTLIGEYLAAVTNFSSANMTFNGSGARPQAMHLEVDYQTMLWARSFVFGASYGETWQALALGLPQNSAALFVNTSIWKDTLQAIEYRHDTDYANGTLATGAGVPTGFGPGLSGTGRGRNQVLFQMGVYF